MNAQNDVTTETLLSEIRQYFGFVPPFFTVIQRNKVLLAMHWQQTRTIYIDNPLPSIIKEKIFIYLSYNCKVLYDLRCHCIQLNNQGMQAEEILALLHTPLPTEQEISQYVKHMRTQPKALEDWPPANSQLDLILFACIAHLFIQKQRAPICRQELQRLLGDNYVFLTALFNYIRSCHSWIEADPDLFGDDDEEMHQIFHQTFGEVQQLEAFLEEERAKLKQERRAFEEEMRIEQLELFKAQEKIQAEQKTQVQMKQVAWQDANQRINDFLSVTAHELKTPITTIKGTIQILLRTTRRDLQLNTITLEDYKRTLEAMQRLLTRADNQIRRLTQLINDIVYLSRIQDKKLEMCMEPQDLSSVLSEIVNQQNQLNPNRTIRIIGEQAPMLVIIDKDHIEQVLTNYLSNALKYSQENQQVTVTLEREGKKIRVAVHDQGPGITREDQQHIWERFYRVQKTEVQSGSGIGFGLGLYISRTIIERHHGEVGVSSKTGEGTTFWFTLNSAD
ncbi:sensor histidine kinase [Dictyobacter arantiisoli]|uniref:histidine kinase n=1 Tax=Dictyobacter arantiisoli TaxID=2014874 RepID=A0A5A5TJ33_9CHLR|nr:HAMP domain-containing sensor histidine kinase [Dictyobacter arantiisoli]GCF11009.1 hypothetical protein KDI_45730 [Dictyobacter arantiisoli]